MPAWDNVSSGTGRESPFEFVQTDESRHGKYRQETQSLFSAGRWHQQAKKKKNDALSLEGHMQSVHRLCTGGQTDVNEACRTLAQIWKHNRGMNIWIILVHEHGCQSCNCSAINSFWIQFDKLRKYANMDLTLNSNPAFLHCYAIKLFFHSYNCPFTFYFCFVYPHCEN